MRVVVTAASCRYGSSIKYHYILIYIPHSSGHLILISNTRQTDRMPIPIAAG